MNDLESVFQKPLSRLLELSSSHLFTNFAPNSRWIGTTEQKKTMDELEGHTFQDNNTAMKQFLLHCFGEEAGGKRKSEDVSLCTGARFMPTSSSSSSSSINAR